MTTVELIAKLNALVIEDPTAAYRPVMFDGIHVRHDVVYVKPRILVVGRSRTKLPIILLTDVKEG